MRGSIFHRLAGVMNPGWRLSKRIQFAPVAVETVNAMVIDDRDTSFVRSDRRDLHRRDRS
jgi:hypothetical protein